MEKWKDGINLENSDKKDVLDYLNTRLFQYKVEKSTDKDLWELYKGDFANFDINTFGLLDRCELYRLRAALRYGGIYIEYNHSRFTIV
jgi:hypothetical protein